MKQPLMSMKRKVGEGDKSGFSFWNKVQFDIFNMSLYEPAFVLFVSDIMLSLKF